MLKEQEKEHLLKSYSTSQNVPLSYARAQVHAQSHQAEENEKDDDLFRELLTPRTPVNRPLFLGTPHQTHSSP